MVAGSYPNSGVPPGKTEYRKIQELASGGMGSVELARASGGKHSGEVVAIKRLHPHLEREKHFADMFFDEAWITAGLNHPNVVEIFDWGTDSIGRYLALEFVPGDTLLTLIRDSKKRDLLIPVELALYIIGKTAEGLHAAHELRNEEGQLRHLVHRDVTPSNVMLGVHGEVKLIDFGVAKARDKLSHTSTGTIKGKFGYMSPEQARGYPIDRRSDVFSLGVVLWETLALRRLYRSESELEILRMIVDDPPTPITQVRNDVPPQIENLIDGALAKNRDDRLGSCGEFADFIWAIYHEHGYTAGEAELAAYFRTVMPERCTAIEQLLSGGHDLLEPTVARPASGSFSGVGPRPVSGAISLHRSPAVAAPPVSAAIPLVQRFHGTSSPSGPSMAVSTPGADGSLLGASYTAPSSEPARPRTPLFLAVGAIGLIAIAGLGWALGHARGSNASASPQTMAAATPAPAAIPAVPSAPQALAAAPPVTATALPAAPAANASAGARAGSERPSSSARGTHRGSTSASQAVPMMPPIAAPAPVVAAPAPAAVAPPPVVRESPRDTTPHDTTPHAAPVIRPPTPSTSSPGSGTSGGSGGHFGLDPTF